MTTVAEQPTAEERLEQCQLLMHSTCHRFIRQHGGDFEECASIANMAFALCNSKYKPDSGMKFSTWLAAVTWHLLLDNKRRSIRDSRVAVRENTDLEAVSRRSFSLSGLLDTLSDDAADVVQLLFDMPSDLDGIVYSGNKTGTVRALVRKYVKTKFGYDNAKVKSIWSEVRSVVGGC